MADQPFGLLRSSPSLPMPYAWPRDMRVIAEPTPGWSARPALARAMRSVTFLVPVALAAAVTLGGAAALPRPATGLGQLGWLAGLLAASWVVSLLAHHALVRLLPLAALLELSLCFPEGAPSRLRLARRGSSAAELAELTAAPPDETAQHAAERMLTLITALATHDRRTRGHAERVRAYADLIAESMGMSPRDRDRLRWAALLHDIGKLHVPAALLNKSGAPNAREWTILRDHPRAGAAIAAPLLAWLAPMHLVIEEHHERWDGTGYPSGKAGRELSVGARIVQVADSFEVMTAARSYKRSVRKDAALRELVRCAGTQFDPQVVRSMVAIPKRKLLWAAGPAAWLAELPLLGHGTTTLITTTAGQFTTVAASAALVGAATLSPAAAGTPPSAPSAAVVGHHIASGTTPARRPRPAFGRPHAHSAPEPKRPMGPATSATPSRPKAPSAAVADLTGHPRSSGPAAPAARPGPTDLPVGAPAAPVPHQPTEPVNGNDGGRARPRKPTTPAGQQHRARIGAPLTTRQHSQCPPRPGPRTSQSGRPSGALRVVQHVAPWAKGLSSAVTRSAACPH